MKRNNNKGVGLLEIVILIAITMAIISLIFAQPIGAAELQRMYFTCYCPESCPGTITASGQHVREGILASSKEHMGDGAILYLEDGTCLGIYECLDTGGGRALINGTAVDVWAPTLEKAQELMELTGGVIYVTWIDDPRG